MPPTPEGRMSSAGDKLVHEFSADDFCSQTVEVLGYENAPRRASYLCFFINLSIVKSKVGKKR